MDFVASELLNADSHRSQSALWPLKLQSLRLVPMLKVRGQTDIVIKFANSHRPQAALWPLHLQSLRLVLMLKVRGQAYTVIKLANVQS